ncbi:hypothetical protein B0H10DRAFT_1830429 [Mycena sp. CBHHK59/15]|nr:hypothetical protein B0H10DRAFT_1830429 [Mycena sp. CBHHK59/15]
MFLSAPSFAVVGASENESKFGTIVRLFFLLKGRDVVPINPFASESQGIPCLKSLADLPDPARTSVSIVTQPSVTLEILRQAKQLGVFAVWLQPGAEDEAVLDFMANSTTAGHYIYTLPPLPGEIGRRASGPCDSAPNGNSTDLISTLLR